MTALLVILAGLPSSGKSTIARALKSVLPSCIPAPCPEIVIIDPDQLRGEEKGQIPFRPEEEPEIKKQLLQRVTYGLGAGQIIIVDDLNYYQSMRHDLLQISLEADIPFLVIFVNTPLEICKIWNQKRGSKIPDELIERIAIKFDYFERYSWDKPDFIINPSSGDFSQRVFLTGACRFLQKNPLRRPRLQVSNKIEVKQPLSIRHLLDVRSRKIISEFLSKNVLQSREKEFLKIRKDLLKKNPTNLEETEKILKEFRETLEIKAKDI